MATNKEPAALTAATVVAPTPHDSSSPPAAVPPATMTPLVLGILTQLVSSLGPLSTAFLAIDVHRDGLLSPDELKSVFSNLKIKVSKQQFSSLLSLLDSDKDGKVSYEEFIGLVKSVSSSISASFPVKANPFSLSPAPPLGSSRLPSKSSSSSPRSNPAAKPGRSLLTASGAPMDGVKMAELTAIKLKEMDSLTKKMLERRQAAVRQIEIDRLEISQIDLALSNVRSRLLPLALSASSRVAQRDELVGRLALADAQLRELFGAQSESFESARRRNVVLERRNAAEVLREERSRVPKEGRSKARREARMGGGGGEGLLVDKARKEAEVAIRIAVPSELLAKLDLAEAGGTAKKREEAAVPRIDLGKVGGGGKVVGSQSAR